MYRIRFFRPVFLVVLATVIVCGGCFSPDTDSLTPYPATLSPEILVPVQFEGTAKGEVLQRLMRVGKKQPELILGQNIGCACNSSAELEYELQQLESLTADRKRPLLLGIDYGWGDMNPEEIRRANRILIDHWNRGGLVTINFDPGNPVTGKPDPNDITKVDLRRITLPGTAENRYFNQRLRIVAEGLRELQQAGVVVLWRPLHEPNGGWFWWCSHDEQTDEWTSPEHYRQLWEYLHHELTKGYRLDNLIWVYSPASMAYSSIRPTEMYYPGDDFVDVIGVDLYTDAFTRDGVNPQNGFSRLRRFNKPLAICEMGSHRLDGSFNAHQALESILTHCPEAKYILFWHSWNEGTRRLPMALVDCLDAEKVMQDPRVLTLSNSLEIPQENRSSEREILIERYLDHQVTP